MVVMVVAAMAVVMVTIAVIQARVVSAAGDLVGFEQAHAQQQRQRHVAFHRTQNPGVILHLAQL